MLSILMMSAKMATLDIFKIKIFYENEGNEVMAFAHDVTNKVLLRDSNYAVDVAMWPKFDNSSVSIR